MSKRAFLIDETYQVGGAAKMRQLPEKENEREVHPPIKKLRISLCDIRKKNIPSKLSLSRIPLRTKTMPELNFSEEESPENSFPQKTSQFQKNEKAIPNQRGNSAKENPGTQDKRRSTSKSPIELEIRNDVNNADSQELFVYVNESPESSGEAANETSSPEMPQTSEEQKVQETFENCNNPQTDQNKKPAVNAIRDRLNELLIKLEIKEAVEKVARLKSRLSTLKIKKEISKLSAELDQRENV